LIASSAACGQVGAGPQIDAAAIDAVVQVDARVPDACSAPDVVEFGGVPLGGGDLQLVQIDWGVNTAQLISLQVRSMAGNPISARTYNLADSYANLIGAGDIFSSDARLMVFYKDNFGAIEEFAMSAGTLQVSAVDVVPDPGSISFSIRDGVLTHVRTPAGAQPGLDYEPDPNACPRVLKPVDVVSLPLPHPAG